MKGEGFFNSINKKDSNWVKVIDLLHKQFDEEIETIESIFEGIENNAFGRLSTNSNNTNVSNDKEILDFFIYSIHSNFLSSGYRTLRSISLLVSGNLPCGDVMALLRRYIETLYIFIFFVFLYENYNKFENKMKEKLKKWKNSKDKEFLAFPFVNKFIIENKVVEKILELLKIDSKFLKNKRDRLNDFIHYNGFIYLNYDRLGIEKTYKFIKEIIEEIKLYTKIFILFCTTNCEWFCTSIDYVSCLEEGIEPEEGSQYWIMPVLKKYIIKNFSKEEINYIRDNSSLNL